MHERTLSKKSRYISFIQTIHLSKLHRWLCGIYKKIFRQTEIKLNIYNFYQTADKVGHLVHNKRNCMYIKRNSLLVHKCDLKNENTTVHFCLIELLVLANTVYMAKSQTCVKTLNTYRVQNIIQIIIPMCTYWGDYNRI